MDEIKGVLWKRIRYGSIKILISHLREVLGKEKFIIRPSEKNTNAIKSYEKAGFRRPQNTEAALRSFYLNDEYLNKYGDGDYGSENTATLIIWRDIIQKQQ